MDIVWLTGDADQIAYVKGWVDIESEEVKLEFEGYKVRHCYGAKLQTGLSRDEGWNYEFRTYDESGCGRFKCTVVER